MKQIGIIKEFDNLGRIVIPKELRQRFYPDGRVEIVATEGGILLKNPEYQLVRITNNALKENPDIKKI